MKTFVLKCGQGSVIWVIDVFSGGSKYEDRKMTTASVSGSGHRWRLYFFIALLLGGLCAVGLAYMILSTRGTSASQPTESAQLQFERAKTAADEALRKALAAVDDLEKAHQKALEEKQAIPLSVLDERIRLIRGEEVSPETKVPTP